MLSRFFLTSVLIAASLCAQAQGIHFESGNWASVRAKAQQQNRLIYVDVYTTWCGPCKILASQIFPQKVVGDKFNAQFVNYRIDAEKGEGIDIAKKYEVNGYPTHLFIDPQSEKIVYRGIGTPENAEEFNQEADVALQEKADPMTWEKYVEAYKKGKKDSAFLVAFIKKGKRLEKDNDPMINDYVSLIKSRPTTKDEIDFLMTNIRTVDNLAMPILYVHRQEINAAHPDQNDYFDDMANMLAYATLEKAVQQKNPGLLGKIDNAQKNYTKDPDIAQPYWFRTQYYTRTGDQVSARKAGREEATFLCSLPESYFVEGDKNGLEDSKSAIRSQLKMMNVPADQIEALVDTNLNRNPSVRRPVTAATANKLNNISWEVYEKYAKDAEAVKQALVWSQKAMDLSIGMNEWSGFADTKAHLLYVSNQRVEAIALEQKALQHARSVKSPSVTDMETDLKKMQEGKL
jgi:thiol-disulfide isomerase/thioredoxin